MNNLDAMLSGDDLHETHAEIRDIWRVVSLSKDDIEAELEEEPDHPHHAQLTEVAKHLNAALAILTRLL
jgi:hypothetical protein